MLDKIEDYDHNNQRQQQISEYNYDDDYNNMFSNMNILYGTNISSDSPQRRLISQEFLINNIANMQNNYIEDRLTQNAILSSLQDLHNNNENITENEAETVLDFDDIYDENFNELDNY